MKKSRLFYPITVLIAVVMSSLLVGCGNSNKNTSAKIRQIYLDQIATPNELLKLSEIADHVSYVQLETTSDCLFTPSQYLVRGDHIFARDRDNGKVFLFNRLGKFIRQIGTIGQGPEEHLGANFMQASPSGDKVYLFSKKSIRLSCYSAEGQKLSEFAVKYASWWFAPLANDQHIFLTPYGFPSPDSAAFLYYLQDNKGKVTRKYFSSKNIPLTGVFDLGIFFVNPINTLSYQPLCDTVFSINNKGEFLPKYALDFGKNRIPNEVWFDKKEYEKVKYDDINYLGLVETKSTLFVRFIYQKSYRIGLVSLMDGKVKGLKTEKGLIENDLDGGPDFWPSETDGMNFVYRFLQPVDLIQQWQSGELKNKKFKNQAEREKFVNMVTSLKEGDNAVVMIVEVK